MFEELIKECQDILDSLPDWIKESNHFEGGDRDSMVGEDLDE